MDHTKLWWILWQDELLFVTNSRGLRAVATCHMLPCTSPRCYLITPRQLGLQTTFWQPQSPQGMWLHRQWTGVSLARAWTPGFLSAALITSYCWCELRPLILPAAAEHRTGESCWKHGVPVTFPHFFHSLLTTWASSVIGLRLNLHSVPVKKH